MLQFFAKKTSPRLVYTGLQLRLLINFPTITCSLRGALWCAVGGDYGCQNGHVVLDDRTSVPYLHLLGVRVKLAIMGAVITVPYGYLAATNYY